MTANSRRVESNQDGVHPRLREIVERHFTRPYRKPIDADARNAFAQLADFIRGRDAPVILDAGCGTGESTIRLAAAFPDHLVVGVDKSAHRLAKAARVPRPPNTWLHRGDLRDFYRLMRGAAIRPVRHYILYPNPYPKAEHILRRWHGHPVFPDLLALGGVLELRSNWTTYVEEFAEALKIAGGAPRCVVMDAADPFTPFERKYAASGQTLYGLVCDAGTIPASASHSRATSAGARPLPSIS